MSKSPRNALSRFLLSATAGVAALSVPGLALAQPEPEPEPASESAPASDEVELSEEGIADEGTDEVFSSDMGMDENPDDPNSTFNADDADKPKAKAEKEQTGYPSELIYRPLNLPGGMVQASLDVPVAIDPFAVAGTLTGLYGITSDVEIGLQYSPGRFQDEFDVGRAVALEAQYLVTDFLAAEVSLPMYLDPFAMGLVFAAPIRYELFDTMALIAGEDFVSIKLHEFIPTVDNATANNAALDLLDANALIPDWAINMKAGAIYQMNEKTALDLVLGVRWDDSNAAQTGSIDLGLLYANTNMLDFGARIGTQDFADFTEAFTIRLFTNLRI